jgi:hypothetical protein
MPDPIRHSYHKSGFPLAQSAGKVTPHGQRFATKSTSQLFPRKVVPVLLPMPAERAYSYALPEGADAVPGQIVQAPLGAAAGGGRGLGRRGRCDQPGQIARDQPQVFDCPPIVAPMRRFIDWVASLYAVAAGACGADGVKSAGRV